MNLLEFRLVLGRLTFVASVLEYEKPFLSLMFSWVSAVQDKARARLPWAILFVMRWLAKRLQEGGRLVVVAALPYGLGETFRADAKAEDGRAWIGGWESWGGRGPASSRWFSLEILETDFPWAFTKAKDPQRFIAALELLGSLLCIGLFSKAWPVGNRGCGCFTGISDNQGNTFLTSKMMSGKFPMPILLTEVSEQMRMKNLVMDLQWVSRDDNVPADELSNSDFHQFDMSMRMPVVPKDIQWLVLPKLMAAGTELFQEITEKRTEAKGSQKRIPRVSVNLKCKRKAEMAW